MYIEKIKRKKKIFHDGIFSIFSAGKIYSLKETREKKWIKFNILE